MHLIERYGLLNTLLKTLESQNPKLMNNQISDEIDSLDKRLLDR
jgi:hypothetical protein